MRHRLAVGVLKALYNWKQSGRVWYQQFTEFEIIAIGISHDAITLSVLLIKHLDDEFVMVAIYDGDFNLFGTPKISENTSTIRPFSK